MMHHSFGTARGFTLIETMVAVSLLSIAIVAPMALTTQSLTAAFYARDQVTAFNLAQEGIEAVRAIRDGQILQISQNSDASGIDLFGPIPVDQDFTIDSRQSIPTNAISSCSGACPALQTDGTLYGYDADLTTWLPTHFTRTLHVKYVGASHDEIRVSVTVSWPTASGQTRSFTIFGNLYRWVQDGAATS
ncbi:MAG: seg [Candidatus Kaiserbacteria bacterium]|nr:seg [Candidatus Kaiserbacteria bacterium]